MINVGVIGLGMMGGTHLSAYGKLKDKCKVIAVADRNPDKLAGDATKSNITGRSTQGINVADFPDDKKYAEGMDLIQDPDIDMVDICLITPMHLEFTRAAVAAGKHVLVEKPLCRTHEDAMKLVELAASTDRIMMPAMCMRFWPEWVWLKQVVEQGTCGKVLGAQFRRVSSHPGGEFYSSGDLSGGALLDLHIHDTDFIQYLFGTPKSVVSSGYSSITDEPDHVVTQFHYDDVPLVVAEGGWAMQKGHSFQMQYTVNFENATARFDLAAEHTLQLTQSGETKPIACNKEHGYYHEIDYILGCIAENKKPETVTIASGAETIRICEAEKKSIDTGAAVSL